MTEEHFREHIELREELQKALDIPALKMALSVIENKAKPRQSVEPRPNTHLDTLISHQYHRLAGIQYAVDTLERLTKPNALKDQVEEEPEFYHGLPDVVKQALKQRNHETL